MYRYPFTPYPNGWYRVAYSHDLNVGDIKRVSYLGEELVVFRGFDGEANVIDTYCPHLGADFSAGGRVVGNTIACPFHDWRFDGNGQCVEIPYCDSIPRKAAVRSWPVREQDGLIFIWYHAEGIEPEYEIPAGPMVADKRWNKPMLFSWKIRMHIQEVAENAVDTTHFPKVHAYAKPPHIESLVCDGPSFTVKLDTERHGMQFTGTSPMTISYTGMGVVHAKLITRLAGKLSVEMAVYLTTTPVDEEHCEIRIMACHRKSWNPLWDMILRPIMKREIASDFKNDIPIWEAKQYLQKPILCKDDGPIGKLRKWARQFYSDNQSVASNKIPVINEKLTPAA